MTPSPYDLKKATVLTVSISSWTPSYKEIRDITVVLLVGRGSKWVLGLATSSPCHVLSADSVWVMDAVHKERMC